jgi:hypothetical protein
MTKGARITVELLPGDRVAEIKRDAHFMAQLAAAWPQLSFEQLRTVFDHVMSEVERWQHERKVTG